LKTVLCHLAIALLIASVCDVASGGEECTTAVITGVATVDGRPILWKNRDTDSRSNKVVYVPAQPYAYLAVVDAVSPSGRLAWGGVNAAGFAIINSVAYNLPRKAGEMEDLEGFVMADALRLCATVADFEAFLKANLGPDLGSRTNYCVIDAGGGAAIFEVHNHGYKRLDASAASGGYLLNTNFSRSGTADEGRGYLRFDRESELFKEVPAGTLTHGFVLQDVSRDLGHALLRHPPRSSWKEMSAASPVWVHSNYTINRLSTASSILIHGVKKGEDPRRATLWVILGEPVCSIAVPLWVAAASVPPELREGDDAPIVREALRLKGVVHPLKGADREEYLDVTRLDNAEGSGWLPGNLKLETEILEETARFLTRERTAGELEEHEKRVSGEVLKRLRGVK
jgi:hypothetical protein